MTGEPDRDGRQKPFTPPSHGLSRTRVRGDTRSKKRNPGPSGPGGSQNGAHLSLKEDPKPDDQFLLLIGERVLVSVEIAGQCLTALWLESHSCAPLLVLLWWASPSN